MTIQEQYKELTHEAILQSALYVFSHKGYADATIKEISRRAGCNALTIFRHFSDKKGLFSAVIQRYHTIDISGITAALHPGSLSDDLHTLSEQYFKVLFTNLDILRIFIIDCPSLSEYKDMVWYVCPQLSEHFIRSLEGAGIVCDPSTAEMHIAFLTKLALEFNNHDRIWEYDDSLLEQIAPKLNRQISFLCNFVWKIQ